MTEHVYEHLLVFVNRVGTTSLWQWVGREDGRRKPYEHRYHVEQPGDSLLQKLEGIAFSWDDLDEEGRASITAATERAKAAFATEKVTKRFYDEFKGHHDRFLDFIQGVEQLDDRQWYASVMLNRLMFIYFIQKKGFLGGDGGYLGNRLAKCRQEGIPYYQGFLVPLFFEGLGTKPEERSREVSDLLGDIPYLNGGLFMPHQIETENPDIDIPDTAFERLFQFFDQYQWHLDDRPLRADNEINPDVLGYIFEKYINQKELGAYYTKEDITGYISKNTVLPFLFDKLQHFCWDAVVPLPIKGIEPYIYDAVAKGADRELPEHIAAGLDDVSKRQHWNEPADPEYALPTEIWREHIARRQQYQRIKDAYDATEIIAINDFITYNLDIIKFPHDLLNDVQDPMVIRAFYFECLKQMTILDPTCGSGAFLFAVLNLLEPLYEICLERMEEFLTRKKRHPQWATQFEEELERLRQHPSRRYFIYKSIIVNNLFGVDILEEAVEIAKLRMFLKLMAEVEDVAQVEPLPDIDFNILAGNTLVGYATLDEIEKAKTGKFDFGGIVDRVRSVDRSIRNFRDLQTQHGFDPQHFRESKANLQAELREVQAELNKDLAAEYGTQDADAFIASHRPLHWYVEFNDIIQHGGFDVIIGNPPYLEMNQIDYEVRGYECGARGPVHSLCVERSLVLLRRGGRASMIMPLSLVSTQRMRSVQNVLERGRSVWYSNYSWRPAKLFDKVNRAFTIFLAGPDHTVRVYSTHYRKWHSETREWLMPLVRYAEVPRNIPHWWVPKLHREVETSILRKCFDADTTVDSWTGDTKEYMYYRTTGGLYWKVFTDFPPAFFINGKEGHSSRETTLSIVRRECVRPVIALLSSSLFWWWYTITTNCRDLNPSDIKCFPVTESVLNDHRLAELGGQYLDDLRRNSHMHVRDQRQTGRTQTQLFKVQKSKPIIDNIDCVLAEHYGFTDEELDFIINYDIKYRMGGAAQGGED